MQDYITSILALAALSFLCSLLFPTGEGKSKKTFEFVLALIFLTVLVRPLSLLSDFSPSLDGLGGVDIRDIIEEAEGETMTALEAAVGEGIAADIASRFSLPPAAVSAKATLTVTDGELIVTSLSLSFGAGTMHADHMAVRDYARKTYTQNCEVQIHG